MMYLNVFQSTLLQEERRVFFTKQTKGISFNPRSYKRSDVAFLINSSSGILSIHAPTRGATTLHAHSTQTLTYFQSTLLQEERLHVLFFFDHTRSFNPRSYKRSDGYFSLSKQKGYLSIHAPTRGATKS